MCVISDDDDDDDDDEEDDVGMVGSFVRIMVMAVAILWPSCLFLILGLLFCFFLWNVVGWCAYLCTWKFDSFHLQQ